MKRVLINGRTGRVFPCCFADCFRAADREIAVAVPHDAPRFPGEKLVYTFCSWPHAQMWADQNSGSGQQWQRGPLGLVVPAS